MKQLIKRLTQFSAGTILAALLSIIQVPIITYFILPEDYGMAGLFNNILAQVPLYLYFGMDQSFSREYHEHQDKSKIFINSIIIPLINAIVLALIILFFDKQLSLWFFRSEEHEYLIWLAVLWIFLLIFERFILLFIRMQERAKEFSFYSFLLKFMIFIITLILIILGQRSFEVVVLGFMLGQMSVCIILLFQYKKLFNFQKNIIDVNLIKQMLLFGLPQMISVTLTSSLASLGNLFINVYSTTIGLGLYNLSLTIVSIIGIIRTAFNSFWLPTAYRWRKNGKSLEHFRLISDILLLTLSISFFILLLFLPLIPLFIGEGYYDVIYIVPILTLPHILATLSETTTLGILFSKKTLFNIVISIATFITSLGLNFALTPKLGYIGASIASAIAYFVYYILRTYFSKTTGFYFNQKKQFLTSLILLGLSCLYAFKINNLAIFTLLSFLIVIFIQKETLKELRTLNNGKWDFD